VQPPPYHCLFEYLGVAVLYRWSCSSRPSRIKRLLLTNVGVTVIMGGSFLAAFIALI
jgi:hypothetical protein